MAFILERAVVYQPVLSIVLDYMVWYIPGFFSSFHFLWLHLHNIRIHQFLDLCLIRGGSLRVPQ